MISLLVHVCLHLRLWTHVFTCPLLLLFRFGDILRCTHHSRFLFKQSWDTCGQTSKLKKEKKHFPLQKTATAGLCVGLTPTQLNKKSGAIQCSDTKVGCLKDVRCQLNFAAEMSYFLDADCGERINYTKRRMDNPEIKKEPNVEVLFFSNYKYLECCWVGRNKRCSLRQETKS